jgi:hypothetical protein
MAKSTWESGCVGGAIETDSGRVRALSVRVQFGADSLDGECGARLEVMSRRMADAEGAAVGRGCNSRESVNVSD